MIADDVGSVARTLSQEALVEQVVEECGELVQAGAKMLRIFRGENPTNKDPIDNVFDVEEELADVLLSIEVLARKMDIWGSLVARRRRKLDRWLLRLKMARGDGD